MSDKSSLRRVKGCPLTTPGTGGPGSCCHAVPSSNWTLHNLPHSHLLSFSASHSGAVPGTRHREFTGFCYVSGMNS